MASQLPAIFTLLAS